MSNHHTVQEKKKRDLYPKDEWVLVQNVRIYLRTKAKDLVEILAEVSYTVSLATVKKKNLQRELRSP